MLRDEKACQSFEKYPGQIISQWAGLDLYQISILKCEAQLTITDCNERIILTDAHYCPHHGAPARVVQ